MKIGFTGTRNGMTLLQRLRIFNFLKIRGGELHHGCCEGSDTETHGVARGLRYWVVGHPPTDQTLRRFCECDFLHPEKPYLVRNRYIVDSTDELLATPAESVEQRRGGTWSTIRYARKVGKPITIILPDGTLKQEVPRRASAIIATDETGAA